MGIRNVLRDNIAIFLVNLGFWPNDLDAFTARTGWRFHDVHMFISWTFTFDAEFTVILREDIRLRTKVKFTSSLEHFLCPLNILPHQIFSPNLKRLGEVVNLLVLRGILELLRFTHSGPENVPFSTVWRNDSYSRCFHSINHRVINMRRIMHFEAEGHVLVHHSELVDSLHLLERAVPYFSWMVNVPHERLLSLNSEAVLRVREIDPDLFESTLNGIWLYQVGVGVMRLQNRAWYLSLFSREHGICNVLGVISLQFIFVLAFILNFVDLIGDLIWCRLGLSIRPRFNFFNLSVVVVIIIWAVVHVIFLVYQILLIIIVIIIIAIISRISLQIWLRSIIFVLSILHNLNVVIHQVLVVGLEEIIFHVLRNFNWSLLIVHHLFLAFFIKIICVNVWLHNIFVVISLLVGNTIIKQSSTRLLLFHQGRSAVIFLDIFNTTANEFVLIVTTVIIHNQKVVGSHLSAIRLISNHNTIELLVCLISVTHCRVLYSHTLSVVYLLLMPRVVLFRYSLRDIILDNDLLLPVWLLIHLSYTISGNKIVIWIVANFDILWVLPVNILEGTLIRDSLIA